MTLARLRNVSWSCGTCGARRFVGLGRNLDTDAHYRVCEMAMLLRCYPWG